MRVPNPRLTRLAGLTKGAIIEQGDGELLVSPLLQAVLELSSPLNVVFALGQIPSGNYDDSFYKADSVSVNGASALVGLTIAAMNRGPWVLEIQGVFVFTGTTNTARNSFIALVDPDANPAAIFQFPHIAGAYQHFRTILHLTFQRDGFSLNLTRDITIAADFVYVQGSVNARRLL
jgi:hypothetical protein